MICMQSIVFKKCQNCLMILNLTDGPTGGFNGVEFLRGVSPPKLSAILFADIFLPGLFFSGGVFPTGCLESSVFFFPRFTRENTLAST